MPARLRVVQHHRREEERDEGGGGQRQRPVVEPEHRQQYHHQRAVHHRGQRRSADRFPHLGCVVDPRQDLSRAAHLEESQGQAENVARIPGDQRQIHIAADVDQQIVAKHPEQRAEDDDQRHAHAQDVEQVPLVAD